MSYKLDLINQFNARGLSEKDIRKKLKEVYQDLLPKEIEGCWYLISRDQILSEDFIREFQNEVNWIIISKQQKLSEEFIREFKDIVDWYLISEHQNLSEDFIREFQNKINWNSIVEIQKLSEDFIWEFQNKLKSYWRRFFVYQELSEGFIRKFLEKELPQPTYFKQIIGRYQKLSKEFIEEFELEIPDTCWLYKTPEWKENYIRENTDYPIEDGMIIAYKSARLDRYSCFNFRYKYEVGKEYTSRADHNIDNRDSFGLSAWTKGGALVYYDRGKLFKVGIKPEDLACVVQNGNKLRATKIKILEEIDFE